MPHTTDQRCPATTSVSVRNCTTKARYGDRNGGGPDVRLICALPRGTCPIVLTVGVWQAGGEKSEEREDLCKICVRFFEGPQAEAPAQAVRSTQPTCDGTPAAHFVSHRLPDCGIVRAEWHRPHSPGFRGRPMGRRWLERLAPRFPVLT